MTKGKKKVKNLKFENRKMTGVNSENKKDVSNTSETKTIQSDNEIDNEMKLGNPDTILINSYISVIAFIICCIINCYNIELTYSIMAVCMYMYYFSMSISNPKDYKKYMERLKNVFFNFLAAVSLYGFLIFYNPLRIIEVSDNYIITNMIYAFISFFVLTYDYNKYEKKIHILNTLYHWVKKSKESYLYCSYISGILYLSIFSLQIIIVGIINLIINSSELFDNELVKPLNITKILIDTISIPILYFIYILFLKYSKKNHIKEGYESKLEYYKKNKSTIDESVSIYKDMFKIHPIDSERFLSSEPLKKGDGIVKLIHKNAFAAKLYLLSIIVSLGLSSNYYEMYILKNDECINKELENENVIYLKNGNVLLKKDNGEYIQYEEKSCLRKKQEFKIKK